MGKRSNFEYKENMKYYTPQKCVLPLIPHLDLSSPKSFAEPCVGDGALVRHLEALTSLECIYTSDLYPDGPDIERHNGTHMRVHTMDASRLQSEDIYVEARRDPDLIITNPPWVPRKEVLHPIIDNLIKIAPTWILLDANWMFTLQAGGLMKKCERVVTIGRVKWIQDSKGSAKDDSCWYFFDEKHKGPTFFYGREK